MKYFFWIAFAVFLAASIPHVAYFFASFEPSSGPEGVWWWGVSYAIAISIDVTVYLLSWTAFQRYRRYRTAKAVWQHWLLIVMCTVFSWAVNWAYAKQFHSTVMLSSAESAAPWLTNIFPFMASAFPLLGIVYTMMAETITETAAEEKTSKVQNLTALAELARQAQLPMATIRRALTVSTRVNQVQTADLQGSEGNAQSKPSTPVSEPRERPITGHIVAVGDEVMTTEEATNPALNNVNTDGNPDKLQLTMEVLKANPTITDEALAQYLSLKRPASARFWRLKALEILNAPGRNGLVAGPLQSSTQAWNAPAPEITNGALSRH